MRPSGHDPSAELRSGFAFQEEPASRAARSHCPHPARRHKPRPGRGSRPSPPRPAPAPDFHAARPSPDEIATMVIAVPFVVEGWHAPAGRRTREPRPLAQARQIRPAAPVGARNWDPAGKPVAGQPQRRRPDRRSGRVPGSDATPVPPQNPGSKTACRNRSPHPPCRIFASLLSQAAARGLVQISQFGASTHSERPGLGHDPLPHNCWPDLQIYSG